MKLLNIPKAVFLLDNHPSHINEKVEKCADEQGIIMMRFPPNLTHLLQPCDSSIFARFEKTFNDNFNPPQPHSSSSFLSELAKVLPEALTSSTSPSIIKSEFQKTGIWPVMEAPILSRVSGSPVSQRTEKKSYWDSELYGKFSPTNKRIKTRSSHMHSSDMKPAEGEKISISNFPDKKDDSIPVKIRTKKVKQSRNRHSSNEFIDSMKKKRNIVLNDASVLEN
ncbi:uncharacterized protein MONOS_9688 [Monocercomonoides exilis]|uniref:uncharacterized protein n=1 Tax=Monocercomonoides exilis TaxID=2049356 RepID=UPI00355AA725|nr:hypothetical protein MONOS_9688 [Monocercomonoides exilis]|eukprot:MONOS_9688.1-p1 / transcript=MONOS_9688.1 / gene=MONOS_9688 / organism=Monocercomonoides_exilis_PA203 / gene_product=unspecified product / transcript_product=unspecified product / location=Mono_scaffold00409:35972-36914(+) / protein_length=222 / sequence_SO=supercontig / SO=protein_coding / is_pseudo=false